MIKAHQIQLNLTKAQKVFMAKSCGVARFGYNWALAKWKEDYEKGKKSNAYTLIKHLNSIKKEEYSNQGCWLIHLTIQQQGW